MDFSPPFADWLKHRRKELDLTQDGLARRAHFSLTAIRQVEEGTRIASRNLAEALAVALEVPQEARETFIAFTRGTGQLRLNHLPAPLTPLLGRETELAGIARALTEDGARLITLIGPPGVGKTRLAQQVARDLQPTLEGGASFVALAPISEPGLIPAAIAAALQNRAMHADPSIEAIARFIEARQTLLVMDNYEHLLAGAPVLNTLLERCPGLRVLVTSRALLNLFGERVIEVGPLKAQPASELFARHAASAKPAFRVTQENAPIIAEICLRLDNLPLAIELAAARARMLTPLRMLERLTHHPGAQLELLTSGPRDWPARQRTLRATIEWSYALLTTDEQRFFRRMGVFAGGCGMGMASAVCGASVDDLSIDDAPTEALLQSLIDKSLIQETFGLDGTRRFDLLETLREYALVRLEESGEGPAIRLRMAHYLCQLARSSQPYAFHLDHMARLFRLAAERDNIRVALNWSRGPGGDCAVGLQLAGLFGWVVSWGGYWKMYLPPAEVAAWMIDIETRLPAVAAEDRTSVLFGLTDLAMCTGDLDVWRRMSPLIEDCARRSGDTTDLCLAEFGRILATHCMAGDFVRGVPHYEKLLEISRANADWLAFAQNLYGRALAVNGQPERAIALMGPSLAHWAARGILWAPHGGTSTSRWLLAMALIQQDDYARARVQAELAVDEVARGGWTGGEAPYARMAALAAAAEGRADAFCAGAARMLRIYPGIPAMATSHPMSRHFTAGEARCLLRCAKWALLRHHSAFPAPVWSLLLLLLGRVFIGQANYPLAARFFGAAEALAGLAPAMPADPVCLHLLDQQLAESRVVFSADPALVAARETGTRMSFDDIIAFVLALEPPRDPDLARMSGNKTLEGLLNPSG